MRIKKIEANTNTSKKKVHTNKRNNHKLPIPFSSHNIFFQPSYPISIQIINIQRRSFFYESLSK